MTTVVEPEVRTRPGGTNDGEDYTHIVKRPPDKVSAEAWVTEARVYFLEVEALCGYRWVPQRDPEKHPMCPACSNILSNLPT